MVQMSNGRASGIGGPPSAGPASEPALLPAGAAAQPARLSRRERAAAAVTQDKAFSALIMALWAVTSIKSALASPLLAHHNLQSLAGAIASEHGASGGGAGCCYSVHGNLAVLRHASICCAVAVVSDRHAHASAQPVPAVVGLGLAWPAIAPRSYSRWRVSALVTLRLCLMTLPVRHRSS